MASIQEKVNRATQISKNTAEGAHYAEEYSRNLNDLASEMTATVQGSQTGERAVSVVRQAANELSEIASALSKASAEIEAYAKKISS